MRALVPVLLAVAACRPPAGAADGDVRERTALAVAVAQYWEGVRWNDVDRAAVFVEDSVERQALARRLEDDWERWRIVDARVVDIELGPEREFPEEGRLREATVLVRLEGYGLPEQVLERREVEQAWYRTARGWWLDVEEAP